MDFFDFLSKFLQEFYWEIILGLVVSVLAGMYIFGRNRFRRWQFSRKINPKFEKAIKVYEKEILPEFIETKPKVKILSSRDEIPEDLPFGYIFVLEGEEELIWSTLIAYLPVSSSLKKIRILFDESLRKSMFNLLSYELGLKLGMEDLAVNFRDDAMRKYPEDFRVMENMYEDGKLTTVILPEASKRLQITRGHISSSDVEEFSILVRKIANINASVVRIGTLTNVQKCVEEIVTTDRGVVLLARGRWIEKAIEFSERLQKENYEKIPGIELELSNPEEGIWHFEYPEPNDVPFMRIWLRKKMTDNPKKSKIF